jgi:conjugal transfer pilus assembly protein TraD
MDVGVTAHTDDHLPDFSAGYTRRITESDVERVPSHVFTQLPDLQYFASLSGGRLFKGRVPILIPDPVAEAAAESSRPQPARAPQPAT